MHILNKKNTMKTIALFFLFTFSIPNIFSFGVLKSGTPVIIRLQNDIKSEKSEQPVFIVAADIKDLEGNLLIAQGTPVNAEFKSKKRKGVGKQGEIDIKFIFTTSTDGQIILLNGTAHEEGENLKGKALGVGLGVGLLLLFPMLAYMAKKGGSAQMKSGTIISSVTTISEYSIK